MTANFPLVKSVLIPLAESVFLPLGSSAGMSPADAAIQRKICGLGTTVLIISNEEMENVIKIFNSREESGLLIKGISETIKNEAKEHKKGVLGIFLGLLCASLLEVY